MSGDSITLETAEERELYRGVLCAVISSAPSCSLYARTVAEDEVRAYRERLPGSESVGGSSLDVDPYKLASALGWHGPAFGMIEEVARIKATVDAASAASDPGSRTPSGCPPQGGHDQSVIVPCPGCRNDVLARVVNGRVDDPWCCDCLTEQAPDEHADGDAAWDPLSRVEVNDALADNGVNLEVKPWPTEPSGVPDAPGCAEDLERWGHFWWCARLSTQEQKPHRINYINGQMVVVGVGPINSILSWHNWGGLCTRGDSGDASNLQAEVKRLDAELDEAQHELIVALTKQDRAEVKLTALRERLGELADGLQRRRLDCESLGSARGSAKASAYGHAAYLLRASLHED